MFEGRSGTLYLNENWGVAEISSNPLAARMRRHGGSWRECVPFIDPREPLVAVDPDDWRRVPVSDADSWKKVEDAVLLRQFVFSFDERYTPLHAFRQWFSAINQEARAALVRYGPSPWNWRLLQSLSLIPQLRELAGDGGNPALAWAVGTGALRRTAKFSPRHLARLFVPGKGQLPLLNCCGFLPATHSTRKLLAKIPREDISFSDLAKFRKAIGVIWRLRPDFLRSPLSHVPKITRPLIKALHPCNVDMLTPRLILELVEAGNSRDADRVAVDLRDVREMYRLRDRRAARVPRFHSLRRLRETARGLNDRLANYEDTPRDIPLSAKFPPFPREFPGNAHLQPVVNAWGLRALARVLRNCLWDSHYPYEALNGETFIYSLSFRGERGAVALSCARGRWAIEAKGNRNSDLSQEGEQVVQRWFRAGMDRAAAPQGVPA